MPERDVAVFLHVLGIILLIGNVTATSVWKVFADRTGDPATIAFAQRLVTLTDFGLTSTGIALTIVGGYWAALATGVSLWETPWLLWGQALFVVSGLVWLGVLVPIQIWQAKAVKAFTPGAPVPEAYRAASRRWLAWGVVATVPLAAALWLMVAKPYF
jgi:uncharacterized membrane protein